ncbi:MULTISPECIES: hypothetical protein [Bacteria]|uniref:hypothetical protein n=1 Tax=Bacteria TaxID=2 RepID=UPI003C7D41D6
MPIMEHPKPEESGSLATAPLDKLLVRWRNAAPGNPGLASADIVAHAGSIVAFALDDGRMAGHDTRAWVAALGKCLAVAEFTLGPPPFGDDEIQGFLQTIPAEEPREPA